MNADNGETQTQFDRRWPPAKSRVDQPQIHTDKHRSERLRRENSGHRDSAFREKLLEEAFSFAQAFVGECHRLCLSDWVRNVAFVMEPVHRVPIERLPYAVSIVKRQIEKRKNGVIDLFSVEFHRTVSISAGTNV